MKTTELKETRQWQARFIGRATLLVAYDPLPDIAANAQYIVMALDTLGQMTRQLDTRKGHGGESPFDLAHHDVIQHHMHNTLYRGSQMCAGALGRAFSGLARLAVDMGVSQDDEVQLGVKRALSARKVLVRRELANSADALIEVAKVNGLSPSEIINEIAPDTLGESFKDSLVKCREMGVSKDFIDRIRAKLGMQTDA